MKTTILSALLCVSASVPAMAAQTFPVPAGTRSLYIIDSGKTSVTSISRPCAPGRACIAAMSSVAKVTVALGGCLDTLGPVTSQVAFDRHDGKLDVFLTVLGVSNPRSMLARCFAQPTATFTVPLGLAVQTDGSVRFHFADSLLPAAKR